MDERKESAKLIITNRPKHMIHMSEQQDTITVIMII
jgi:hypothetical protein